MKKILLILTVLLIHFAIRAQQNETLKLEECIRIATIRNPVSRQRNLYQETLDNRLKNLRSSWYPAVSLGGQAVYNSETINFSDAMGGLPVSVPSLPLDQYKLWTDINQQIYDGGSTRARRAVEKSTYESDIQQVETELRNAKEQVVQVYFSLLLTEKNAAILQVSLADLTERKKSVKAGVENGALLAEDLLALEAEALRYEQRLSELKITRVQLIHMLSVLMDSTFTEDIGLSQPQEPATIDDSILRPEYVLFNKQKDKLAANQSLVSSADLPRLFAFSQLAYGRPGYNPVSQDFHSFYSVGLGMKWNFLNYGDNKRQIKIIELQKDFVDVKKDVFTDQLVIQLETERTNIDKYADLELKDEQIVKLRKTISAASFAKLNQGIITSSDYIVDLNSELMATLQYENHKIQKLQAAYKYLLSQGKL